VRFEGRYATVERLDPPKHGDSLWPLIGGETNADLWRWMPDGPFPDRGSFDVALEYKTNSADPLFFAILENGSGLSFGIASLMRNEPKHRVVEVGGIMFSQPLQRTRVATEAMYLMAKHAFETMGYRRYEWKCNSQNEPSRAAALRLGFTFEGIFRQHMIIKGVNRDTAWFSMIDSEWLARRAEFERWLDPANFTDDGQQLTRLNQQVRCF